MRALRHVTGRETEGGGVGAPCRVADDRRPLQSVVTLLNGVRGRSVEGRRVPVTGLHRWWRRRAEVLT